MGNDSLPDDADFLAASAVAALAIAVSAGSRVKDDLILADWVREIGELPSWRDDARAWKRGLHVIQAKYNLPTDAELAARTIEQSLFNRVRSSALDAVLSQEPRARHFHLSMASIAAGSLFSISLGAGAQAAIEAAVSSAYSVTGSQGGIKSNEGRNASKRKGFEHLSTQFTEIPRHEKGAAKGKPDLPKLTKALQQCLDTSHYPEKTRKDWARAWVTEKAQCASAREA